MSTVSEIQPPPPASTKISRTALEGLSGVAWRKAALLYLRRVLIYLLSFYVLLHLLWAYEAPHGFVARAFILGLPGMLPALLPALLPARASRLYLLLSYIFLAVPAFICAMHLGIFQTPVSAQSFFALLMPGPHYPTNSPRFIFPGDSACRPPPSSLFPQGCCTAP